MMKQGTSTIFTSVTSVVLASLFLVASSAQHTTVLGTPTHSPVHELLTTPMLPRDDHDRGLSRQLTDLIRRARQIKFKSSYRELPEVLRLAEELNRASGKQLSEPVHVGPSEIATHERTALKALPPASEVYFQPQVIDKPKLAKAFNNNGINNLNTKRRRLKKKMIARKLVQGVVPSPHKVENDDAINFETSSTKNFENTIRNSPHIFRGKSLQSQKVSSQKQNHSGGPNPDESFRNPYYIETPPNEISSYSFVPENSRIKPKNQEQTNSDRQSSAPKPSRLTTKKPKATQRTPHVTKIRPHTSNLIDKQPKPSAASFTRPQPVQQKPLRPKSSGRGKSLSATANWDHFLKTASDQPVKGSFSAVKPPEAKNSAFCSDGSCRSSTKMDNYPSKSSSSKQNKSFNNIHDASQKTSGGKSNFPDLVSVPPTDFHCGDYRSGEYFADVDTNCQVFHVCFGGRQASFVCPVGTAFSQQLLVCDWWHKVDCGNRSKRSLVAAASYVPYDTARTLYKTHAKLM